MLRYNYIFIFQKISIHYDSMIDRILYGRFYKGDIMSRMTKEEVKQRVCKAIVDNRVYENWLNLLWLNQNWVLKR